MAIFGPFNIDNFIETDTPYGRLKIQRDSDWSMNRGGITHYRIRVNLQQLVPQFNYEVMEHVLRHSLLEIQRVCLLQTQEEHANAFFFRWMFYNSTLRKGIKSDGYTFFGNNSIEQCILDLGFKYFQNEEHYDKEEDRLAIQNPLHHHRAIPLVPKPRHHGVFGNHFSRTQLVIEVQQVSKSVAQGSWEGGGSRIVKDFFITKLLSETNCVYQALVFGRDLLHEGDNRSIKEVISLHSKDCKGVNSISNRARKLKHDMMTSTGAHQQCYAIVLNTVQEFANSTAARCDVHVYIQGEYRQTILRQFNRDKKNAQQSFDNHQSDLYIDITGNHAEAMVPRRYMEASFPRIVRAQTKIYKINGETKSKRIIAGEWTQQHVDRIRNATEVLDHCHIKSKGEDNQIFLQNVVMPLLEQRYEKAKSSGKTMQVEQCEVLLSRLKLKKARWLTDYMHTCTSRYTELAKMSNEDTIQIVGWNRNIKVTPKDLRREWSNACQVVGNIEADLPERIDELVTMLKQKTAFANGIAEVLAYKFMSEDGFNSVSEMMVAMQNGEMDKANAHAKTVAGNGSCKVIDKLKLCKNQEEVIGHASGVEKRNRKLGAYDFECAPDIKGEDQTYAAGLAWLVERNEVNTWLDNMHIPRPPENITPFVSSKVHQFSETIENENGEMEEQLYLYINFYGNPSNPEPSLHRKAVDILFQDFLGHEDNIDLFRGYTFYAHNGGKYDMSMLMQSLLDSKANMVIAPSFKSSTLQTVEQSGRYIDVSICHRSDELHKFKSSKAHKAQCIHLRDSLCFFAGGLKTLACEYKVPHLKLDEEFDVLSLGLSNFHVDVERFHAVDKYLSHDCLGLVEAMNRMSIGWFASSWCEVKQPVPGTECKMRRMLLSLTGYHWNRTRNIKWLTSCRGTKLELDLYCPELKMAVEVNGVSHQTENCRYWQKKKR